MTTPAIKAAEDMQEPGRFGCPACPSRFESVGDKRRHIRDTHRNSPITNAATDEENR